MVLVVALVLGACSESPPVAGRYVGHEIRGEHTVDVVMTLAPDGTGTWRVQGEETRFSWSAHGSGLRIYTSRGGVVEATWHDGALFLELPGWGAIRLRASAAP